MNLEDGGPIRVGAREIYDKLLCLERKVDRLVTAVTDAGAHITDHEQRLRSLESTRWPIPALATVIAIASLILGILTAVH